MEFGDVTAMSIGGHQATEAWLAGVKVWSSAPVTTYYFPFRLMTNGNYMTLNEFTATSWGYIILNDANLQEQLVFTQNDVGHIEDSNNNVIFVLSTTSSTYSAGGVVSLSNSYYEYSNGIVQQPATRWSLDAFLPLTNDISGISLAEDEVQLFISDGSYTWRGTAPTNQQILHWEISVPELSLTPFSDNTNTIEPGTVSSVPWGNDISTYIVPSEYWGRTVTATYSLESTISGSSGPFSGNVPVQIPNATGQGSMSAYIDLPDIIDG